MALPGRMFNRLAEFRKAILIRDLREIDKFFFLVMMKNNTSKILKIFLTNH